MAALDNIASELLKSANEADLIYKKTRDQAQRDKAVRLRRIVENLKAISAGGLTPTLDEVLTEGNVSTNTLNVGGITSDYFQLDTTATPTLAPGMFAWNDAYGTADLRLKGNNVTLQVGQEILARVVNKTGSDLLESQYKVVRIRIASEGGAQGQRLAVVLAQGDNDPDSTTTLGVVTETILNNQEGFITILGNVNNINTTGSLQGETWVDGDVLYLSPTTPGSLTKVKPVAPQHTLIVGYVVYAHINQGKIFVKVDNGYELDELHNVLITSPANNDLLQYNSTQQVWKNVAASVAVPTPTLAQVTTAGNTTTNAITVGGLVVDTNTLVVDSVNNRLGIGTATPTNTLDVNGTLRFGTTGNLIVTSTTTEINIVRQGITTFITSGSAGNAGVGTISNAAFTFFTNNGAKAQITAGGNFLIGTTTDAGYKLDVNGTTRLNNNTLVKGSNTANNVIGFEFQNSAGSSFFQIFNDGQARFYNNVLYYSSIIANDIVTRNIGITLNTNSIRYINFTGNVNAVTALARGVYLDNTLTATANNDVLVGLDINPTFTNGAFTGVSNYALRTTNSTVALFDSVLYSQAGPSVNNTSFSISGTTNSHYTINSVRNLVLNTSQSMYFNTDTDGGDSTERAWYFAGARSGLTGGRTYVAITTNSSGFPRLIIYNNDNNARISLDSNAASYFNGGNLLIGTTTDAGYKLDVNGSARINNTTQFIFNTSNLQVATSGLSAFYFNNAINWSTSTFTLQRQGGGVGLHINASDNVGIGTTSPTDKFHIVDNTNGNKFGRISAGGTDASAAWVAQNDQVDNVVYRVFGSAVTGSQMGQALARSASLIANLGGTGKFLIGSFSGTDLIFGTSDQARMRLVDATGNFLIGTMTDNGNKLTVSGDIDAQGYKVNNVLGYTGILNIPTNPPGQQNIDIQGGIVINIF